MNNPVGNSILRPFGAVTCTVKDIARVSMAFFFRSNLILEVERKYENLKSAMKNQACLKAHLPKAFTSQNPARIYEIIT